MSKILFTKKAADFILDVFDKRFNDETGFAEDKKTGEILISPGGEKITRNNFTAIIKDKEGNANFLAHHTEILDVL